MRIENNFIFQFIILFIVSKSQQEINVLVLHSYINSHKSGPLHLIGQPYSKKGRSARAKDGISN